MLGASGLLPAFIPILLPFAVLIVPLLDFGLAVFRRLRAGKSPFSADRKHLHHRLLDMGHTHLHAVLIFYGWTAVASVGMPAVPVLHRLVVGRCWSRSSGLLICTIVTLSPLSRRKAAEAAVQSADPELAADAGARPVRSARCGGGAFRDRPKSRPTPRPRSRSSGCSEKESAP